MKICLTATQVGMTDRQKLVFRQRLLDLKPSALIHGGCVGGDDDGDQIAAELGIPRLVFPQSRYPQKRVPDEVLKARTGSSVIILPAEDDPILRNERMVRNAVRVLACPRQKLMVTRSGTWTTVRRARTFKVPVEVIDPT